MGVSIRRSEWSKNPTPRLGHATATVVRCAAAQTNQNSLSISLACRQKQLAHTAAAGIHDIAFQRIRIKTYGCRGLDVGESTGLESAQFRVDGLSKSPADATGSRLAVQRNQ